MVVFGNAGCGFGGAGRRQVVVSVEGKPLVERTFVSRWRDCELRDVEMRGSMCELGF